jgi:hypothetical protein
MPSVTLGQTLTGCFNRDPYFFAARCCPAPTTLADGSKLICKAGGVAWFVAPNSTQIQAQWANGQYNSTQVGTINVQFGDKCCTNEWGTLSSLLAANVCCYVANQWFVPSFCDLVNPGLTCASNWSFFSANYWSSTEFNAGCAYRVNFLNGTTAVNIKSYAPRVRAFRCVTY